MRLVDTHVHLHSYPDYDGMLLRAARADVAEIVAIGIDVTTSRWNIETARHHHEVIPAVGLHPLEVRSAISDAALAEIHLLASDPSVKVIGEIGVDTEHGVANPQVQLDAFRSLLGLATRVGKPVNLHLVGAVDEALGVLREAYSIELGAIAHYFTGDSEDARRLLDAGMIISVGKPVTKSASGALREAVKMIPDDRLLLETDSYPLPGRATEPANLPTVARAIANIRRCPVEAVAERSTGLWHQLVGQA